MNENTIIIVTQGNDGSNIARPENPYEKDANKTLLELGGMQNFVKVGKLYEQFIIDNPKFHTDAAPGRYTMGEFEIFWQYSIKAKNWINADQHMYDEYKVFEKFAASTFARTRRFGSLLQKEVKQESGPIKIKPMLENKEYSTLTGMQLLNRGVERELQLVSKGFGYRNDINSYFKDGVISQSIRLINVLAYNEDEWQTFLSDFNIL